MWGECVYVFGHYTVLRTRSGLVLVDVHRNWEHEL